MFNNRDEQALRETAELYGDACRSAAHNILGSREDAEECLNDALLAAWNTIPPEQPQNLCAYILKIVRNAALNRWKSRRRGKRGGGQTPQLLDELAEILPAKDDVETELEKRELMQGVTAFLRSLPQKQRDLFVCRYWQAEPVSALARRFDMTETNVRVTLGRIRNRLQEYLRKEELL